MTPQEQLFVEHLPDVNENDDSRLLELLICCFKKPEDHVFKTQHYWQEISEHRWVIRDSDNRIIAHVAVHDKTIGSADGDLHIGGIAEVCTNSTCRQRGYAMHLLAAEHVWMAAEGRDFAMLFGDSCYYNSSGDVTIRNPLRQRSWMSGEWVVEPSPIAMVRPVSDRSWPNGVIDLRGPVF